MFRSAFIPVLVTILALSAWSRTVNVTNEATYRSAIQAAQAGDTILIAAGTYPDVQAPQSADGTQASPILVKGESVHTVIFDSYGEGLKHYPAHWIFEGIHFKGNNSYHLFHIKGGSKGYLTIRNCHFSGVADKAIKIDFAAYNGAAAFWPDYILVEGCTMEVGQGGLMNNDGADYMTCRGNYTYGFVTDGVGYIYFSKGGLAYSIFENNLVDGGRWGPISVGGGSMSVPGDTFRHDNDLAAGYPAKSIETINSIIRNNIIIGGEAGVHSSTTLNCEIYNNTIINCVKSLEIHKHHGDPVGLKFFNNLLIKTGGIQNGGAFLTASNNVNVSGDPTRYFMDYKSADLNNSDFRIKPEYADTVGKGISPSLQPTWQFYAMPTTIPYDYYGTYRTSPPTVGATEVWQAPTSKSRQKSAHSFNIQPVYGKAPGVVFNLSSKSPLPLVDALICDLQGRHIRTLYYGPMGGNQMELRWDGLSHRGKKKAAGNYILRVSLGKDVVYERFVLR